MTRMLKAQYTQRGPVPQDVISAVPFDRPALAEGQALVAVLAAPINPGDVLTLTGHYGMLPPLPAVGGSEGVGRVVELAPGTPGPAVGQTVLLPPGSGTWSTHVVVPAARLIPLPNEADAKQLAMLTVNPPTASLLLSDFREPAGRRLGDPEQRQLRRRQLSGAAGQVARLQDGERRAARVSGGQRTGARR
ncbi:alcohol dehydrogenase catalytic domain-containing protein [Caenimonas sedimenti]|uniref:alcohol dehydrogenase catalytic domain-containing protein n=1 Tax=Caenimonas sedimenti TaxID=2596921 RepID=UPI00210673EA|nr:alcohol dehydrogenase catalytic domain-containing protein [Caenimonas sedimenti]